MFKVRVRRRLISRISNSRSARDERLAARVPAAQKRLLQRAADLQGKSLSGFVLDAAREAALTTIREHEVIVLSQRDAEAFIDALMNPQAPNDALKRAVAQHREAITAAWSP